MSHHFTPPNQPQWTDVEYLRAMAKFFKEDSVYAPNGVFMAHHARLMQIANKLAFFSSQNVQAQQIAIGKKIDPSSKAAWPFPEGTTHLVRKDKDNE